MDDISKLIDTIKNTKQTLFIFCGYPYSGKSHLVKQITDRLDITCVSIDDIFHADGYDWTSNTLPGAEQWQSIFDQSYEETKKLLIQNQNVLYDSTNHTVASRNKLREIARSAKANSQVIYVKTPVETVWQRWAENNKHSNRPQVAEELVQTTMEMFEEPEGWEDVIVVEN